MAGKKDREKRQIRYSSAKKWAESESGGGASTCVQPPDGVGWFKLARTGTYKIDILPFVAGKNNPHSDEGFVHYERTYEQHYLPTGQPYCCLSNWGKACPVCKWCQTHRNSTDPMQAAVSKSAKAKTRILWALFDVTNEESKAKGTQLWETGDWKSFGETMKNKVLALPEYEDFFHLDGGSTLVLNVVEDSFTVEGSTKNYKKVGNIEMVTRKRPYPEELLDEVPCLDALLVQMPYKDLEKVFLTAIGEASEADEPEVRLPSSARFAMNGSEDEIEDATEEDPDEPEDETEDEPVVEMEPGMVVDHPKHGRCEVNIKRRDGTVSLMTKSKKVVTGIPQSECTLVEEEEESEEEASLPPPKPKSTKITQAKKEEILDELDDEWADDEETPPPKKPKR